jgi:hypothetical protein
VPAARITPDSSRKDAKNAKNAKGRGRREGGRRVIVCEIIVIKMNLEKQR